MTKLRHLEPYGFNEQPQFNGLVNTVKANIENIKKKNEEQDEKDVEQDANITQVTSTLTDSLNQKLGSGFTGDNSANTVTSVIESNEKVTASALNDLNDRKLDASELSKYYKKEETSGKTELNTAFGLKADASDLTAHTGNTTAHITSDERTKWNGKISSASYDSKNHKINFYNGATTEVPVSFIDATDFIKDGMVKQVEIKEVESSGSCLVITFNADAGNEVITIPVSKIFDSGKYYQKTEIDASLAAKADTSALTTHAGNTDIHITAAERTKWNNADANSHTHGNKDVLDTIRTIDFELNENSKNLVVNSAITKVILENEKIVSASLNDLNDRKLDSSAYTPTDLSDYYKKEETSGKTELDAALAKKANVSDFTAHTNDSTIHHTHSNKDVLDKITAIDTELSATSNNLVVNSAITKVIVDNEKVVASSLNDLNDRKLDSSAYTPTDLSDYYKKEETSGKTEIDTALAAKSNTGHKHQSSDISDIVTEITASNSDSTSVPTVNAVMQLINAKLDINYTGFTGTTLTGVTTIIQAIQKIADKLDKLPNG